MIEPSRVMLAVPTTPIPFLLVQLETDMSGERAAIDRANNDDNDGTFDVAVCNQ